MSKLKEIEIACLCVLGSMLIVVGCSKSPVAPVRSVALNLSISNFGDVHSNLLGAANNEIYYHVQGDGAPDSFEVFGPFSAPASTGTVDFTVQMPGGVGHKILNLQLNDAANHQPLAVGAVDVDPSAGAVSDLVVELGSVTRNCYFVDESRRPPTGGGSPYSNGSSYGFQNDDLIQTNTAGPNYDIGFNCPATVFYMLEAQDSFASPSINAIAYMGNGQLVDFDGVPADSDFFPLSTQAKKAKGAPVSYLQTNDVYCVKLGTMTGHAWVQITDPGQMTITGPSFRFRVNKTLPYYSYDETIADANAPSGCSTSW
jgi:hypothetical protein